MSVAFNADEVFRIALQIEENGVKFYSKAAGNIDDASTKSMLLELADFERKHEKTFGELRERLGVAEQTPETFDPEGLAGQYLGALADRRVFDMTEDPSEKLTGDESVEEVLKMALQAEKDSIVLYLGMQEMVPEPFNKNAVYKILTEEMSHVTMLTRRLATIVA